jgi:hypothetical protein
MRGKNQYNYIRHILFEIFFSRDSSECINIGGNSKNLRNILNRRR